MAQTENSLIRQLPKTVRRAFLERCEPCELALSAELGKRGKALPHAYFPVEGFISLVIDEDSYPALGVGMIGREAMLGSELILGTAKPPWRALVQGPGHGWRIDTRSLRLAYAENLALRQVLQAFILVRLYQQALGSACERFHLVRPRLARWMLMSQDRAHADSFHVTQEFMALMLGVRRVGVTIAANGFQHDGLIEYHRGRITVLDRGALEAESCSCYAADKQIHTSLMAAALSQGSA